MSRPGENTPALNPRRHPADSAVVVSPRAGESAVVDCALYREGVRTAGSTDPVELFAEASRTPGAFVWIGPHDPDERAFTDVAAVFGLHPLAVEDVLHREQRPKLERYEDIAFLIIRAAQYAEHAALTDTSEIVHTGTVRIFVGERFVVTVREGDVGELRSVRADLEAVPCQNSSHNQ